MHSQYSLSLQNNHTSTLLALQVIDGSQILQQELQRPPIIPLLWVETGQYLMSVWGYRRGVYLCEKDSTRIVQALPVREFDR